MNRLRGKSVKLGVQVLSRKVRGKRKCIIGFTQKASIFMDSMNITRKTSLPTIRNQDTV